MKAIISGYGKMGHMVEASLKRRGIPLVMATEDVCSVSPEIGKECVCIDFTTPAAFRENYPTLAKNFKAVVVGTTGWYDIKDEVFAAFEKEGTALIWASNFSIGVNAFFAAVERVSQVLKGNGYTPSVHEIHHIHKLDAPSGTAKSIGAIISSTLGVTPEITADRIGEVPGTHTATFLSAVDKLTFTHEAFSREGFAEGAVAAAIMADSLEGVHEFKDLIL
ncbi:MAG: 4-hydroxy-tetrahydrodipicolinate reductase [Bacteroidales bacterium]|nr:4-hydroxy-tetrahydrodipicolinate reductase [Bacteroidales bacterium]MBQ9173993.1 4-hydroxy-tetrahydrodipicolinate reductase [Bacteroidales bacterium]MBQ9711328.1 4-hydroxy-tetrahydrodipicolinate reductase [Bacteroidales bacterium]MBR1434970.1 4-hydroxy-tetrahydrodipicolinate reductase [Bacteroidales bacterium]MBR6414870.1 4-hydroxy-tetrahydrodipicolinate reductase [Bacteroidales bacterium]